MKCIVYSTKEYERKLLESLNVENIDFIYCDDSLNQQSVGLIKNIEAISIFVHDRVNSDMSEILKKSGVKFLITRSTGMDHIDVDACRKLGIRVDHIADYGSESIAEHALFLTLCLLRHYKHTEIKMRKGDYRIDTLLSENISGKKIGVIGTGKIGSCYAQLAGKLGGHVIGYDIVPNTNLEKTGVLKYVTLEDIFSNSEIISLHLPLTNRTHYFLAKNNLNALKKKPWIINTARGGLVDTQAMIEAIEENNVRGYAADVYEYENKLFFVDHGSNPLPDPVFNKLINMPNVIITPHHAFAEKQSIQSMLEKMINKLKEWNKSKKTS
jgi:D-lactate dehydrogenase